MKTWILTLMAGMLVFSASAQSLEITNPTTVYTTDYLEDAHVKLTIRNVSSQDKMVKVRRQIISMHPTHQNYFCWTFCYSPDVEESPDMELIPSGGELNKFEGSINFDMSSPEGNVGSSTVRYCFFVEGDESDQVCIDVQYNIVSPKSLIVPQTGLVNLNPTANYWSLIKGEEMEVAMNVDNYGNNDKEVTVLRRKISGPDSHTNYFCWGNCFDPETDQSPVPKTLRPGEGEEFSTYVSVDPDVDKEIYEGTSIYEFCFVNDNGLTDSICVQTSFAISVPTGLDDELFAGSTKLSLPYPNPAIDVINFPYENYRNAQASIQVFDALGHLVKEVTLDDETGEVRILTQAMKAGLYFYRLKSDNQYSTAKKFIVR